MNVRRTVIACASLIVAGLAGGAVHAATPRPSSPSPSPTPNPYRTLSLASATLAQPSGPIRLIGGFAAAKRDGKAAVVCVSFKNTAPKAANRVVFDFTLVGPRGRDLGSPQLDRRGEFSSNVDINGWSSLGDWQGGVGHRGYGDNCTVLQQGVAMSPVLHAPANVVYHVTSVEFSDGTSWP